MSAEGFYQHPGFSGDAEAIINPPYISLLFNHHSYIIRQALQAPFSRSQTEAPMRATCLWNFIAEPGRQTLVCLIPHLDETVFSVCYVPDYALDTGCMERVRPHPWPHEFLVWRTAYRVTINDTAGQGMAELSARPTVEGGGLCLLGGVPEDRVLKDTWMSAVWPGSAVGRAL